MSIDLQALMNVMHLQFRKDHAVCFVCGAIEPIHPGESGWQIGAFVHAADGMLRRHPPTPHGRKLPDSWSSTEILDCGCKITKGNRCPIHNQP